MLLASAPATRVTADSTPNIIACSGLTPAARPSSHWSASSIRHATTHCTPICTGVALASTQRDMAWLRDSDACCRAWSVAATLPAVSSLRQLPACTLRARRYQVPNTTHTAAVAYRLTGPPTSREASSTPTACSSSAGACHASRTTSAHSGLRLAMNNATVHRVPKLAVIANISSSCSASGRNFGGALRNASS